MQANDSTIVQLTPGIVWNIGSLGFVGAVYGAATLGTLHQVLAIYLIVPQVVAAGLYFSVLAHLPMNATDENDC